jgi:NADPH:quinone reductase-like Zn-dependent oxidoreductase
MSKLPIPSPAGFEGVGIIDALGPQVQGLTRLDAAMWWVAWP